MADPQDANNPTPNGGDGNSNGIKDAIDEHLDDLSKKPVGEGKSPLDTPTTTMTDSDDDGVPDATEVEYGYDPQDVDSPAIDGDDINTKGGKKRNC